MKKHTPGWQPYNLDHHAQIIVLKFRDQKNVLNESHKMRMTIAYGLERFWGEHLRLQPKERDEQKYTEKDKENANKAKYWRDVWEKIYEILHDESGLEKFPKGNVLSCPPNEQTEKIKEVANQIWSMPLPDQRVALMVLTQFCDSLVWWTQRYKTKGDQNDD
jgi:hypothetical protein